MTLSKTLKSIAFVSISARANELFAHEGHGLGGGSHWHASDVWGFVAMAALVALAIWLSRRDR
jgi:hypothetical protein